MEWSRVGCVPTKQLISTRYSRCSDVANEPTATQPRSFTLLPDFLAIDFMHRLPSSSSIIRFRCSSLLLWLSILTFLSGLMVMSVGFFHSRDGDVLLGGKLVASGLAAYVMEWALSSRARCPLCMIPPLHPKRCQKNRRARRLLGSYRLRVATSVMFQNHFQCPYCGEATKIAVRERLVAGRIDSPQAASENLPKR